MTQFFAILKDSFREAVDGFVIYVMLGLSALMVVIIGSLSFTPAPPEEGFNRLVESFRMVFPEKGRSRMINYSGAVTYRASDVKATGNGYTLRVTATGSTSTISENGKKPRPTEAGVDSFRETVAGWARPAGEGKQLEQNGKRIEVGGPVTGSKDEQKAVTDAMMEDFVKNQFAVHAGMDATVKRVTGPDVEEPTYAFDVTTAGGSAVRGWPHTVKMFFGAVTVTRDTSLGFVLWLIEDQLINGLGSGVALLISMIITSFFIPNMLRKGSIDLLISKPIGRTQLLLYKYVGGLTFIFLLACVAIGGTWVVLSARSGIWDPSFLVVIPVLTFTFAILYAVSTFVAVFTRSPIAAMLITTGFAVFLYIVGQVKTMFDRIKIEQEARGTDNMPEWAFTLVDTLNNVLPRYKDLDKLTSKLIADGTLTPGELRSFGLSYMEFPSWGGTLGVSLAFIVVMLALSCWRFSKRDY